jgi:23S rRNA (adenine2503-C2)-methyltransferase
LLLSLSTIAPTGCEGFFQGLLEVKDSFPPGTFQFQFSLHTSDEKKRRELIPAPTWSFARMASYGSRFFQSGDRKITLNFALAKGYPLRADQLLSHFDPALFLVKITPVNPTVRAQASGLRPVFTSDQGNDTIVTELRRAGYEVLVSLGEFEENAIGSNCGQFLRSFLERKGDAAQQESYSYPLEELPADA